MTSILKKDINKLTQDELIYYAYELGKTLELDKNHDTVINDLILAQDAIIDEAYGDGKEDGINLANKFKTKETTSEYKRGYDDGMAYGLVAAGYALANNYKLNNK